MIDKDPTPKGDSLLRSRKTFVQFGFAALALVSVQVAYDQYTHQKPDVSIENPLSWVAAPIDTAINNL